MPKIPALNEQQVQTQAYSPVTRTDRFTANQFGAAEAAGRAALGQGIKDLGQVAAQVARKGKQDADSVEIVAAVNKLNQWDNKNLHAADGGAYNILGKEALGTPERLLPDYDKTVSEIEAGLANDDQKNAFRKVAMDRRADNERGLQQHMAEQINIYQEKELSAGIDGAIESAAANYKDPERIASDISNIENIYKARASITNEPPEETARLIKDATSKAHVSVINRMLGQGRYSWAKEYLTANKDDIAATVIDEVDKAVRTGAVREESQDSADAIMGKHGTDRAAALAEARKINDPEVQEGTVDQINQRFNEINQAEQESRKNRVNSATSIISNGGAVEDIPPGEWNQFSREERGQLRALSARGEWYQDDKKWYDFTQADPNEIASMNLYMNVRPYVDDQHWDMALRMKQDILDAKKGNSSNLTTTLSFQERLKNSMVENGVFDADMLSGSKGVPDGEKTRYAKIESEASLKLAAFEANKGSKATPAEMERIIDNISMQQVFVRKDWQSDPEKLGIELQEDEFGAAYVPIKKIPPAKLQMLRNLSQSTGKPYKAENAERAYAAALMGADDETIESIMAE